MLTQHEVWVELREADEQLRHLIAKGTPTGKYLWHKFSVLRRRLRHDPPADRSETVERLRAMRDECWAELDRFRSAVEKALAVAEQREGW